MSKFYNETNFAKLKPVPAREAIAYEEAKFEHVNDKRYTGPPSPQIDKEWHDLLNGETRIL